MGTVQSHDGTLIRYSTTGNGNVNLVFFHGWGGNRQVWDNIIPFLDGTRFRCLNLDFRGHGASARAESGYSWDSFAQDALAVADKEGAQKLIPVGFSLGAKLALYLAARHSNRVPALILVAAPALGIIPISRDVGLKLCRDAVDWTQIRPFFKELWFGPSPSEQLVDACCQSVARIPRSVLEATAEMSLWTSIESSVGKLGLPALVVAGDADPMCHPQYQREQTLPHLHNASSVTLASGHFVPLECPAELAQAISAFLENVT